MSETRARTLQVTEDSRPILRRHVKLRFDEARKLWVILAPERVLVPDEIAVEVLQMCDGTRSLSSIIDELAANYEATRDQIAADVLAMFQDLLDKGFLVDSP